MSKKYNVGADVGYIQGYLRYGHLELSLNEEEYSKFKDLSEDEQLNWIENYGELVVDDWEVNDFGGVCNIEVYEED